MPQITSFKTITEPCAAVFKDRGSQFLAFAYPVENETDIQLRLDELRKEHFKARHHCYAWRINPDGAHFRANDDREPSGTAGRPILGQIDSFGLTNVLIVVVRYFGGTLLGTSGLINAYKSGAYEALSIANIVTKAIEMRYEFTFEYAYMPDFMQAVKTMNLRLLKEEYTDKGMMVISFPIDNIEPNIIRLKAAILNISEDEAAITETPNGFDIKELDIDFV